MDDDRQRKLIIKNNMEEKEKIPEIGKWYKWFWKPNQKITYGKVSSHATDCFNVDEGIHNEMYAQGNGYYYRDCTMISILEDFNEIQQYLPDRHKYKTKSPEKWIPQRGELVVVDSDYLKKYDFEDYYNKPVEIIPHNKHLLDYFNVNIPNNADGGFMVPIGKIKKYIGIEIQKDSNKTINTHGLSIGDILDDKVINAWAIDGPNYYSDSFLTGFSSQYASFSGQREIKEFKEINGITGFLVSKTSNVYLRAEGFKEFQTNFYKKTSVDSNTLLLIKAKEKYPYGTKFISVITGKQFTSYGNPRFEKTLIIDTFEPNNQGEYFSCIYDNDKWAKIVETPELALWLKETKALNLFKEELRNFISDPHKTSKNIFLQLIGSNSIEKTIILYNKWNNPNENIQCSEIFLNPVTQKDCFIKTTNNHPLNIPIFKTKNKPKLFTTNTNLLKL